MIVLVQLADMIAGAIRDHSVAQNPVYRRMFFEKIVDLWVVK